MYGHRERSDLLDFRPAVADNTLFNLKRRVFENRNILLLGGEDDYSPCLSYIYGGFLVCVMVRVLFNLCKSIF